MEQSIMDSQLAALKELTDTRFKASETAVNTALATQEKAVNAARETDQKALAAALQASEKAIAKAEAAQAEVNKVIAELQKDVISLRESRSQGTGNDAAKKGDKQQSNWTVSLLVTIALALIAVALKMFMLR
jgi:anti-sigma-K factor RskA